MAGTALNPSKTDDSTDAYDTIDWLVKHVPESNGKVGIIGISYDGFTPLMALVHPHPALKIAVPMNPMVDGWRGDDWFHNGAFREQNMPYIYEQDGTNDNSAKWWQSEQDDYDFYMRGGSAGALGEAHGLTQMGFWNKVVAHPAYDSFWQDQAMDQILARQPITVPILLVGSLWDAEDIYGYMAMWKALKPKDTGNLVRLSIGPWYHGQGIDEGSSLGAVKFGMDTSKWWRKHVLAPTLAHYLKDEAPPLDVAPVTVFETGTNEWRSMQSWPAADAKSTPIYLKPNGSLGFTPATGTAATVDYVSDPAKPVPYRARPDQKFRLRHMRAMGLLADRRPARGVRPHRCGELHHRCVDQTRHRARPARGASDGRHHRQRCRLGGQADRCLSRPGAGRSRHGRLSARGGDGYFPGPLSRIPRRPRNRSRPTRPWPILFELPNADHVFLPGHRIMVQVQSSWFPLYDRNPQTFVPNIFFAKPSDYKAATQSITVAGPQGSFIDLPVAQ